MTTTTTSWRAMLAAMVATGALLLSACGDGDDKADKDDKNDKKDESSESDQSATGDEGPILDPNAPEADSDFCKGAVALMSMTTDPEGEDDASLDAAEALDPPDAIAEDWDKLMATTRQMQDIDYNDPEASEQAMAAYQDIADEQTKVMTYLQDQCGINVGMPGDSADSEAPPTTGG